MELQTKADFVSLMHRFLDPLKPYYSAGCARLHLGETGAKYKQSTIELEAFSRPLWALVPFWTDGGSDRSLKPFTAKGLLPVLTRKNLNIGGSAKTMTSVLWRWQRLHTAFCWCRRNCGIL